MQSPPSITLCLQHPLRGAITLHRSAMISHCSYLKLFGTFCAAQAHPGAHGCEYGKDLVSLFRIVRILPIGYDYSAVCKDDRDCNDTTQ